MGDGTSSGRGRQRVLSTAEELFIAVVDDEPDALREEPVGQRFYGVLDPEDTNGDVAGACALGEVGDLSRRTVGDAVVF